MTNKFILAITLLLFTAGVSYSQKSYRTSDSEMIFSLSEVTNAGNSVDSDLRWTMFYHTSAFNNHDLNQSLGFFYGVAIRNIGFITRDETIGTEMFSTVKRRSYTAGLPVGIKIGDLDEGMFIFGGFEYEWLFHYKEKRFLGSEKVDKYTDWFSKQTNTFLPSVYGGVNLKGDLAVTFKYYLNDFLNRSYREPVSGLLPYADINSRIFYISISKKFRYERLKEVVKVQGLSI
ncbi:MAG: hypothetical protein FJY11_00875 [Bacteroidetes bacterium]|nr:hypothetical protein [Bacteroidota bacterium]